ncbi:hypothetical protein BN131_1650 [Cronobacter malonaticus 681]|nr:hypothetical protein BN131_1650 [Cronobacter malonaticus 681]
MLTHPALEVFTRVAFQPSGKDGGSISACWLAKRQSCR